jgi:hypothetical protein
MALQWPRRYVSSLIYYSIVHSGNIDLGHIVCEIQLIFRPVPPRGLEGTWWSKQFLVYVARLDVVPVRNKDFDEVTGMHILKRAKRASGLMPVSDVVPLSQVRALAPVIPKFGPKANPRLTAQTSSHFSTSFYLNHFFDKELFFALRT